MNEQVPSKDRVSDFYLESTLNSINLASALDSQLISTAFLRMLLIELIERRAAPEPPAGPPYEQYSHAELCALVRTKDRHIERIEGAVQPPLPDYRAAMKAAECDEGIDCDTFIRVLQKKVADQQRELARLQRPAQPPCDDLKEATRLLHVVNAWFWRSSDDPDSARVDPLYPARGTSCSKAPLFAAIRALLDRYPYGGATSTKEVKP